MLLREYFNSIQLFIYAPLFCFSFSLFLFIKKLLLILSQEMPSAFKKSSIKQQRAPTKVSTPKKIIKKQQDTKKPSNEKATTLQNNKDNLIYYFAEVVFLFDGCGISP